MREREYTTTEISQFDQYPRQIVEKRLEFYYAWSHFNVFGYVYMFVCTFLVVGQIQIFIHMNYTVRRITLRSVLYVV